DGGNGDFSYDWSTGQEGPMADGLEPGLYTVTATDGGGCSEVLAVEILFLADEIAPEVATQDIAVMLDPVTGMVSITPEMIDNGSMDDCEIVELALDQSTFDCSSTGVQTVTLFVTDVGGNVASATATVVVQDNEPVLTVASPQLVELDPVTGTFELDPAALIVEASDDCGVETLSLSQTEVDCSFIGGGLITVVLTDVNGHSVQAEIEVFAADVTPPALTCPEDIVTSDCDLVIEYEAPSATDNCGLQTLIQVSGLGSGQVFPAGTTVEEYVAIDQHGNEATCTFSVTIENSLAGTTAAEETCPNTTDGTASIEVSGGTPGYSYQWSNGETTAMITDLASGNYTVTATDALGCELSQVVTVEATPAVFIQVVNVTDESNGGQNGAIDITLDGGVAPLLVTWYDENQNPVSGNVDLLNVGAGSYTAEVVDAFGCVYTMEEPVVVNNLTGLESVRDLEHFELSPNPTHASCRLSLQLSTPTQVEWAVYRLDGRLVRQANAGIQAQLTTDINLAGQAAGVYLLKVRLGENWLTERIVLMD
ncbi:MAG: HYR domain-containing protein, partial [Phaeodactylibacter sp.]|nr:HYR domain-containing protein [Phaeodactylibacter sp.]